MKKIILMLFILVITSSGFEIDKNNFIYNNTHNYFKMYGNDSDNFKSKELIGIESKISKKIKKGDCLFFYDKNNILIKIERDTESESGDSLTNLKQYYKESELIYFEYRLDVLPDPDLNYVAKGYINNNKVVKIKVYSLGEPKKWKLENIKENLSYPTTPLFNKK